MAVYDTSSVIVEKTIIAFNGPGSAFHSSDGTGVAILTCCDLYGNEGGDWVGIVADQADTNGNFSVDYVENAANND